MERCRSVDWLIVLDSLFSCLSYINSWRRILTVWEADDIMLSTGRRWKPCPQSQSPKIFSYGFNKCLTCKHHCKTHVPGSPCVCCRYWRQKPNVHVLLSAFDKRIILVDVTQYASVATWTIHHRNFFDWLCVVARGRKSTRTPTLRTNQWQWLSMNNTRVANEKWTN
jgi:hypothetical protein